MYNIYILYCVNVFKIVILFICNVFIYVIYLIFVVVLFVMDMKSWNDMVEFICSY